MSRTSRKLDPSQVPVAGGRQETSPSDGHKRALERKRWLSINLPLIEYREAWDLQHKLVKARKDRIIHRDLVLILEHPPVFTLGRRGGLSNLTVSEGFLQKAGISVVQVERGGDITYHGPGQLVVYPIIDLQKAKLKVLDYVDRLEEVMIRSAGEWGIVAERNPMNRGVWVDNKKLGSIGITIRNGVSFHGMAFNINVELAPFDWINPCGLQGIGVTSIEREAAYRVPMSEAREVVRFHMEGVFEVSFDATRLSALKGFLKTTH